MTAAADLEQLWYQYHTEITGFVVNRVYDPDAAEDLVATLYLRAWSAMCNGHGFRDNARAWLYQIVRNLIADYWRDLGATPTCVDVEAASNHLPTPSAHEAYSRLYTRETVYAALSMLSEEQKTVVMLQLDGYSHEEIRHITGRKPNALTQLRHRAFDRIREPLARLLDMPTMTPDVSDLTLTELFAHTLQRHGPMTIPELAMRARRPESTVYTTVDRERSVFVRVGAKQGQRRMIATWGVVGIHDANDATLVAYRETVE